MGSEWRERQRPTRLENRYEFSSYDDLRDFLDRAAELSESVDLYPDMGFGRDYVNVTIHADEESGKLPDSYRDFAKKLDELRDSMSEKSA